MEKLDHLLPAMEPPDDDDRSKKLALEDNGATIQWIIDSNPNFDLLYRGDGSMSAFFHKLGYTVFGSIIGARALMPIIEGISWLQISWPT